MMAHSSIPKGATVSRELAGRIPNGPAAGLAVRLREYSCYASYGYSSNYQKRETRFLAFRFLGQPKGWISPTGMPRLLTWRYSGNRLANVQRDWDKLSTAIAPNPVPEKEPHNA